MRRVNLPTLSGPSIYRSTGHWAEKVTSKDPRAGGLVPIAILDRIGHPESRGAFTRCRGRWEHSQAKSRLLPGLTDFAALLTSLRMAIEVDKRIYYTSWLLVLEVAGGQKQGCKMKAARSKKKMLLLLHDRINGLDECQEEVRRDN